MGYTIVMPICKSCQRPITKFDYDICPYCGCKNPIDENYKTMDMTQSLKTNVANEFPMKSKSRKAASFLCIFFGVFGVHQFYLGFISKGVTTLLINVLLITGLGFLLHLWLAFYYSFPIAYLLFWIYFIIIGIKYRNQVDLKDKDGVLLR